MTLTLKLSRPYFCLFVCFSSLNQGPEKQPINLFQAIALTSETGWLALSMFFSMCKQDWHSASTMAVQDELQGTLYCVRRQLKGNRLWESSCFTANMTSLFNDYIIKNYKIITWYIQLNIIDSTSFNRINKGILFANNLYV